jgi:CheY-like chemotaxis protein
MTASARPLALIVEDNPANMLLAQRTLERGGYRTTPARSAEEALTLLAATIPDVILMDVQLPGMDGLTLTRRLKADPATRQIPVVALTAGAMADDEARVRAAGCDGYLTKPISVSTFVASLNAILGRAGSPAPPAPTAAPAAVPPSAPPLHSQAPTTSSPSPPPAPRILVVDDHPEGVELVRAYLVQEGHHVRAALTGGHAIESALADPPDLILLDVMLPDLDGFEVCRRLRAAEVTRGVPIVMLTALRDAADRIQGLEAGADDFLSKPVEQAELRARVRGLLRAKALTDELIAQRQELQRHEAALQQVNEALEAAVAERTADLRHANVRLRDELASRAAAEAAVTAVNERLTQALADLEAAQQRIVQQERLRALGEMASGIAHDFNNALAPVVGFADLLLETPGALQDEARVRAQLDLIRDGANDAAGVVRRLREFYRPREDGEEFAPVSPGEVVDKAVALTRPRWRDQALASGSTIEAEVRTDPVPEILGDEAELREALTNLIFNAVDAMPHGGTLGVSVRESGTAVRLEVSDTGTGMSEEVRRKCLEPFFSTKGDQGTGLGLAMVYGTVRRHGGRLEIESRPSEGTRITMILPVPRIERLSVPDPDKAADTEPPPVPPLRVLLVDDDSTVQSVHAAFLISLGHTVTRASSGAEAIEQLGERRFELVITDHAMPGVTGTDVAEVVKRVSPYTPVILLTGFGSLMDPASLPVGVDAILAKPTSVAALRQTIARVLR